MANRVFNVSHSFLKKLWCVFIGLCALICVWLSFTGSVKTNIYDLAPAQTAQDLRNISQAEISRYYGKKVLVLIGLPSAFATMKAFEELGGIQFSSLFTDPRPVLLDGAITDDPFGPRRASSDLYAYGGRIYQVRSYTVNADSTLFGSLEAMAAFERFKSEARRVNARSEVLFYGTVYNNAKFTIDAVKSIAAQIIVALIVQYFLNMLFFRNRKVCLGLLSCTAAGWIAAAASSAFLYGGSLHLWVLMTGTGFIGFFAAFAALAPFALFDIGSGAPSVKIRNNFRLLLIGAGVFALTLLSFIYTQRSAIEQVGFFITAGVIVSGLSAFIMAAQSKKMLPISPAVREIAQYSNYVAPSGQESLMKRHIAALGILVFGVFFFGAGFSHLDFSQNSENLVNYIPDLRVSQNKTMKILPVPDTNRFFILTGSSEDSLRMTEEALQGALHRIDPKVRIYSVSKYYPSKEKKSAFRRAGGTVPASLEEPFETWLKSPQSEYVRHLVLRPEKGFASLVFISDASRRDHVQFEKLESVISNLSYVDTIRERNNLLFQTRVGSFGLFCIFAVSFTTISLFAFGAATYKTVLPPILGLAVSACLMSWYGEPFKLFTVLALLISFAFCFTANLWSIATEKNNEMSACSTYAYLAAGAGLVMLATNTSPALRSLALVCILSISACWLISIVICRYVSPPVYPKI